MEVNKKNIKKKNYFENKKLKKLYEKYKKM